MYKTNNLALATALYTYGVPFFSTGGKTVPCLNVYTKDNLAAMESGGRPIFKGLPIEQAANLAWKQGRLGDAGYVFERTALLEEIVKAFDQQQADIKESEKVAEHGAKSTDTAAIECSPADLGRIAAQFAKNRKHLLLEMKKAMPMIALFGNEKTNKKGEATVRTGSLKLYSLNASEETRRRIKL